MLHAPTESQLARHRDATNTSRIKIQQAQLARIRQSKLRTYRSFGRLLSVSHVPPTAVSRDVVGSHGSISKEAPGNGNHLVIYSPAFHQAIDRSPAVRPATAPPRALATCTAARCARPRRPMSPTERDLSALPSRKGSPMWCRAAVPFGSAPRIPSAALYTGKDSPRYKGFEESKRGSFGPGGYDVHAISRTGTPRGHIRGNSAHTFGLAPAKMRRAASANQYEGRELASKKLGSYGPGYYDVLRTSRTGTPRGGLFYDVDGVSRKGTPRGHAKGGVPVFGSAPVKSVRRAASAKRCQEGTLGGYGPGDNFDLHVSNKGTPRGQARGGTPTFGATDKAKNKPRPDLAKLYRGRAMREATERTMRGSFGPGGYALPSGIGRQVLSQRESSSCCSFGQGTRPDFNDVNALASRGPCDESHCIPGAWVDSSRVG